MLSVFINILAGHHIILYHDDIWGAFKKKQKNKKTASNPNTVNFHKDETSRGQPDVLEMSLRAPDKKGH